VIQINVRDGNFADLGGLEPNISWSGSTKSGDLDIEYGIDANARVTTDIASLPKNIWGKASTNVAGWGVSARAEFAGTDFSNADVDIEASNKDADLSVNVAATAGGGFKAHRIEATKGFDSDGARVTVNPRFNLDNDSADVVIAYSKDGTDVEVTASQGAQSVKVSRQIDDENRIAPTLASNGAVSLEWERSLGNGNSLTTTVRPNESVDLEWKDAAWTANINMPLDGTNIAGTNVSIKREVNF